MTQQAPVIHFGPPVPAMTYEKFADYVGMSKSWVAKQVAEGKIPRMPKQGKEEPLVNVAKYWLDALNQL